MLKRNCRKKYAAKQNKEVNTLSNNNKPVVPEAKQALDNMKFEIARENNINLKQGYNGDLTSAQNGKVGGQMVKKMIDQYKNK